MPRPLLPLFFTSGQRLGIFFLLQNLHSHSPRRWHGDFVQQTGSFFGTPDHTADHLLVFHLPAFFSSHPPFSSCSQLYRHICHDYSSLQSAPPPCKHPLVSPSRHPHTSPQHLLLQNLLRLESSPYERGVIGQRARLLIGRSDHGSCSEDIHMEEEKVKSKFRRMKWKMGETNEECKAKVEVRTDNHSGA